MEKVFSTKQVCATVAKIGGEVIAFDDNGSKGISLEVFALDYLYIFLGLFENEDKLLKRLENADSFIDTYLNYYLVENKVILEVNNSGGNEEQDLFEVTGEGKDFLVKEIRNFCNDYEKKTPEELIEEV